MRFETTSWSLVVQASAEHCLERLRQERAARDLGLTVPAVRVAVHRLRRRFCTVLRHEVGRTAGSPAEADAEIRWLLEAVRGSR